MKKHSFIALAMAVIFITLSPAFLLAGDKVYPVPANTSDVVGQRIIFNDSLSDNATHTVTVAAVSYYLSSRAQLVQFHLVGNIYLYAHNGKVLNIMFQADQSGSNWYMNVLMMDENKIQKVPITVRIIV